MYWWQKFFDENYVKVYQELERRSSREVDSILRMMNLESKARILDLCCGYGRHSIELAQKGFAVTGYDLSDFFLKKAKKDAAALGLKIRFIKGDMRKLPFQERFDAVVNVFTSFGYFENERDDLKVLKGVCKALKKDGLFLLDLINRENLIRGFQRRTWRPNRDFIVLEDNFLDLFTSRWESTRTLIFENGKRAQHSFSLRLFSFAEMLESVYGDFDLMEYSLDSPRMILISRKK
jgi:SAM-dependent methyltransferase